MGYDRIIPPKKLKLPKYASSNRAGYAISFPEKLRPNKTFICDTKCYIQLVPGEELIGKINSLGKNLLSFVNEARVIAVEPEISILSKNIIILKKNLNNLVSHLLNFEAKDDLTQRELESLKVRYVSLQKEWDSQQEHLGRIQGDVYALRNQLRLQSAFCASLGSTLGFMLWKVSRLQSVVDLLISTNKLPDLFTMTNGTLASFLETYVGSGLPELYSDEMQFILSMAGVIANIAAIPEGRHLLISEQAGKDLLKQMIQSLTIIPVSVGDPLLRILLMVLYNVSINEGGLVFLQDKKPLLVTACQIIICDRSPDLCLVALRLLESLSFDYASSDVYNLHKSVLPMMKLNTIATGTDAEMRGYAINILSNLEKASERFKSDINTTPFVPYDDSKLLKKVC